MNWNKIKYFSKSEFECHCGKCDSFVIEPKLVEKLDDLRKKFKHPIFISSGYRCPEYNKYIGGVKNSYHTKGLAVDIAIYGKPAYELLKYVYEIGFDGIGINQKGPYNKRFIHLDLGLLDKSNKSKKRPTIFSYQGDFKMNKKTIKIVNSIFKRLKKLPKFTEDLKIKGKKYFTSLTKNTKKSEKVLKSNKNIVKNKVVKTTRKIKPTKDIKSNKNIVKTTKKIKPTKEIKYNKIRPHSITRMPRPIQFIQDYKYISNKMKDAKKLKVSKKIYNSLKQERRKALKNLGIASAQIGLPSVAGALVYKKLKDQCLNGCT